MNPQDPRTQNPYGPQPPYSQNGGVYSQPPAQGGPTIRSGHNPYEFIINPATPKRQSFFNTQSLGKRVAVIGGMIVVLIIIASIVMSALAPKDITTDLIKIDQQQEEILRVAGNALQQANSQDLKNFLTNTEATVTTSQVQVNQYLADHHKKVSPKVLSLGKDTNTDTLLTNALAANNYNQVALQTLITQLQTYATQLQTSYKLAPGSTSKAILQKSFTTAEMLLDQGKAISVQN